MKIIIWALSLLAVFTGMAWARTEPGNIFILIGVVMLVRALSKIFSN